MTAPERGGALLVDKPTGPTSHDVVAWTRKAIGVRRVGHTGTLDPFASGLMVLLVGPATRLAEYLSGLGKGYSARAHLGVSTDTHDSEGRTVATRSGWENLTRTQVELALRRFQGPLRQVPPQFSAKKVEGEAMYKKARRGVTVELAPVEVEISRIEVTGLQLPHVDFEVECSSGTYIRALARDLGEALGVGAHLTALRRTSVGRFSVEGAIPGATLRDGVMPTADQWLSPEAVVGHLATVRVEDGAAQRLRHGGRISLSELSSGPEGSGPVAVLDDEGLVGIGEVREDCLVPRKILPGPAGS